MDTPKRQPAPKAKRHRVARKPLTQEVEPWAQSKCSPTQGVNRESRASKIQMVDVGGK